MKILDAHQHCWAITTPGHEWPTAAEPAIHRDFGISDLLDEAEGADLCGTVLVQSQPNEADTQWMLAHARQHPAVRAVVGWVDLQDSQAPQRIADLAADPKLKGLRPMLQSIADTDWLLRQEIAPAIEAMIAYGLRLDALIQPRHLPMLATFARRYPGLPIVIDHAAKPDMAGGAGGDWADGIAALADAGLWCKLSGLRTEQGAGEPAEALAPFVRHLVDSFGARLMWGSDWPVLHLAGDRWGDWQRAAAQLVGDTDMRRLFSGAAAEFYDIDMEEVTE